MFALNLGTDGRILSATEERFAHGSAVIVEELPEGDISDYRYIDGQYVHEPLAKAEYTEPVTLESRVVTLETDNAEMKEALEMILSGVTE